MNRAGHTGVSVRKLGFRAGAGILLRLLLTAVAFTTVRAEAMAESTPDFSALVADRIAIERIYYNHRLETKPPFEEVLPRPLAEELVRRDLNKEHALKKSFGIEITAADLEAEARRMDAVTHAPEVLAELKQALNNDPKRFTQTVVRPIVVEKRLHGRFNEDSSLHVSERAKAERLRIELLKARQEKATPKQLKELLRSAGKVSDQTWHFEGEPPGPVFTTTAIQSSNYSGSGTARFGAVEPSDESISFGELQPELQTLLKAQLQKPGDLSAVVETDDGFLLFLTRDRTARRLHVTSLYIPKQN
ncbi:MAG: hypothetical protein H7Y43_07870, partial [Akkermansiaceae bacterium]|nr:hypothetical protein [Verrucomicrobiales bacterium]